MTVEDARVLAFPVKQILKIQQYNQRQNTRSAIFFCDFLFL